MHKRILVVDRSVSEGTALGGFLSALGYVVVVETDARLAMDAARRHVPDVVILDLELSNADDIDLVEWIRADERLAGARVFATGRPSGLSSRVSAHAGVADRGVGFERFFPKPVSLLNLVEALRAVARHVDSPALRSW